MKWRFGWPVAIDKNNLYFINRDSKIETPIGWEIAQSLPHGSGIDDDWYIEDIATKKNIYAYNSYHNMDENGFYDGWQDFYIIIPRNEKDFKLKFTGDRRGIRKYPFLRQYLEDFISESIGHIIWR